MRNRLGEDQWYLWRHFAKIARGFFCFLSFFLFSRFATFQWSQMANATLFSETSVTESFVSTLLGAADRAMWEYIECPSFEDSVSLRWFVRGKEASTCFEHFYTRATLGVRPSWEFPEKIRATSGKRWKSNNCCQWQLVKSNQWDFRNQYDFQTTRSGLYPLDLPLAANLEYQQPSQGFLFYKTDDMYQTHHNSLWACFHLYICPTYLPFPPTLLHYLINAREIS